LILAWQSGDQSAADVLLRRHAPVLARFFQRHGGPIDDLVQETFLQCIHGINGFRGDASFRTFLIGIAMNVRRSHVRRERSRSQGGEVDSQPSSDRLESDEALDEQRRVIELVGLVDALPHPLRRVIELQYWSGLTSAQIASMLDTSPGSVRRQQTTARQLLGVRLRRRRADGDS
jgi:RNA polymerase sigma-70 factor (ECF subfamily)